MKMLLLLAVLTVSAAAQTATVYRIPEAQAKEGKRLHDAAVTAQAAFDTWKKQTEKSFGRKQPEYNTGWPPPSLDFTEDFLLAVPHHPAPDPSFYLNPTANAQAVPLVIGKP